MASQLHYWNELKKSLKEGIELEPAERDFGAYEVSELDPIIKQMMDYMRTDGEATYDQPAVAAHVGSKDAMATGWYEENVDKPGLWANIRAKRARGEKPARKGSDAYNKTVAAAKKINAMNEEVNIQESPDGFVVSVMEGGKKIGEIVLETYDQKHYTIIDAKIDDIERGKGYYQKAIIDLLNKKPNIIIHSVFRSPEAERAWQSLLKKLPADIKYKMEKYPEEGTTDITIAKSGAMNEITICETCALRLLEDIKNGKHPITEAEYKGREVKLGKPMKGDVKKYKVYVKNDSGNVVKVNFGDKGLSIKRDNPTRRRSFRARHKCSQKKDRTSAGYWSCRMWSSKPVSQILKGK